MSRRCRLFAVDLDGTLLNHHGQPHQADVDALRQLQAQGVVVSIATGRLYGGVLHAARALDLRGPLACADGSHIADAETGADLAHHPVEAGTLGWLRGAFRRHQVNGFLLERDRVVHDERGAPFLGYVRVWSERLHQHEGATAHPHWPNEVTAMVGVGSEEQIKRLHGEVVAEGERVQSWAFPITLPFAGSTGRSWSMVARAPGPSKGTAIEWLAKHHGLSVDEVVVVGDWHNDVPMFRVAGRSFAMAQAPDDVKAAATDVLSSHSSTGGGIAEAARRAGLLP